MAPRGAVGKSAESLAEYLTKGKQIYVEGRLQTRQWDDKDGNKRYTTEIRGDESCCSAAVVAAARGAAMDRGGEAMGGHAPGPRPRSRSLTTTSRSEREI